MGWDFSFGPGFPGLKDRANDPSKIGTTALRNSEKKHESGEQFTGHK
jgi:hypothetical protein